MPTTSPSELDPKWERRNRIDHHQRHGVDVATALGCAGQQFDMWAYEEASKKTVKRRRLHFEAEHRDQRTQEYSNTRAYYVDHLLLQATTDASVEWFITYFPETFDQKPAVALPKLLALTDGDRLQKYKKSLDDRTTSKIYCKVSKLHGFL